MTSGLPALLESLLEPPLAKELIKALKEMAEVTAEGKLKDARGASRAVFVAGESVRGRDLGILLSKVGAWDSCGGPPSSEGQTDYPEEPLAPE